MKKAFLAVSAVLTIGSALAATTTSTASLSSSVLDKFLENTSVSYYGAIYKNNQGFASQTTAFYHEVTGSYNYGGGRVYIRPRFSSVDGDKNQTQWLNPRVGINPWSLTSGNLFTANEIRYDIAMDDTGADTTDTDIYYGILRYSQVVSYKVSNVISVTGWGGLYKNITKPIASINTKDKDMLLFDAAINFAINDKHSILVDYQMATFLNERALRPGNDEDFYTNQRSNNTLYIRYTNSQIKNLSLTPSVYMNRDEMEKFDSDNLGLQLEISATL